MLLLAGVRRSLGVRWRRECRESAVAGLDTCGRDAYSFSFFFRTLSSTTYTTLNKKNNTTFLVLLYIAPNNSFSLLLSRPQKKLQK